MTRRRGRRSARPWYLYLFGLVAIVMIALGVSEVGAPTSSARTSTQVVTAEDGVVQATVSGTGNVEPGVDDAVNFATSGTLKTIDVSVGEHVKKGQLIATLDRTSAQLTLDEAEDSLKSAEDDLTSAEDGTSTSTGSSSSGSSGSDAEATAASVGHAGGTGTATTTSSTTTTGTTTTGTTTGTTTQTTTGVTTTGTTTTPTKTSTGTTTTPTGTTKGTTGGGKKLTGTKKQTTGVKKGSTPTKASNKSATQTTTTTKSTPSPSAIAQDESSVDSAKASVTSAKKALADTKLYAPVTGTIASLGSDEIGQTVSSGSSSSGSSSSSSTATTAATGSSTTSSTSSSFATIINNKTMTMTVSLSETNISSVKVGQIATVSLSALSGVKLAGKVTSISPLGSSSSGVVSYDVGLTIYQYNRKVLPGMSATATIVTSQAQGVTLPTDAVSSGTVKLDTNGKITTRSVTVGLKGTSREVIESGVKAGQQVEVTITLPALGTSTSSSSTSTTSGFGGAGGATGGFGGAGAAGALFGGGGG